MTFCYVEQVNKQFKWYNNYYWFFLIETNVIQQTVD